MLIISQKYYFDDEEVHRKVISLTMSFHQTKTNTSVINVVTYQNLSRLQLKVTVQLYLLTDRRAQERLILWLESKKSLQERSISKMKGRVLYLVLFRSYGVKLNKDLIIIQLRQALHRSIMSRSKIY